jgi:sn-glycerol 3-phosphate transport system permease protein
MQTDSFPATLAPGFITALYAVGGIVLVAVLLQFVSRHGTPVSRGRATRISRYLLLVILSVIVLFPIYITVVNALLAPDQIAHRPPLLFPMHPRWSTYATAWTTGHLGRYLMNSFIVTGVIVAGTLATSITAGYAFAFLHFPFKRTIFMVFLATMMVPLEVTFFTNLQTVVSLGWYNSYVALIVPFLATGFGAFLMRQAFLGLPGELRDAAKIDGLGHLRFMTRIAVPLTRPAIAALGLFAFFAAFNQYLWPLIVTKNDQFRTVQIGLKYLSRSQLNNINVTFAGIVLAFIPLFVLLVVFQKQLVRGLTAGAVKG